MTVFREAPPWMEMARNLYHSVIQPLPCVIPQRTRRHLKTADDPKLLTAVGCHLVFLLRAGTLKYAL